jgi:hypothetical protein
MRGFKGLAEFHSELQNRVTIFTGHYISVDELPLTTVNIQATIKKVV